MTALGREKRAAIHLAAGLPATEIKRFRNKLRPSEQVRGA